MNIYTYKPQQTPGHNDIFYSSSTEALAAHMFGSRFFFWRSRSKLDIIMKNCFFLLSYCVTDLFSSAYIPRCVLTSVADPVNFFPDGSAYILLRYAFLMWSSKNLIVWYFLTSFETF